MRLPFAPSPTVAVLISARGGLASSARIRLAAGGGGDAYRLGRSSSSARAARAAGQVRRRRQRAAPAADVVRRARGRDSPRPRQQRGTAPQPHARVRVLPVAAPRGPSLRLTPMKSSRFAGRWHGASEPRAILISNSHLTGTERPALLCVFNHATAFQLPAVRCAGRRTATATRRRC